MKKTSIIILLAAVAVISCNRQQERKSDPAVPEEEKSTEKIERPSVNPDSAFHFVKSQTDFGPRVPGSEAHKRCAAYLESTLERFADKVYVQEFKARAFDGRILEGKNIIGSFMPEQRARISLAAHWDSRPFADHDPNPENRNLPVPGANDGASGVGVLLEIARVLSSNDPPVGVDIIFFDIEDYGPPHDSQSDENPENWGLGSQHWSKNPHEYNYRSRYLILLDMVGAPDARFLQEGFSMYFAPDKVRKVWGIAHEIGYNKYFINERGGYINDDHYFVNEMANIPAINIIHLDPGSSNGSFFEYWHTIKDDIDKIDPQTLELVGEVVLEVLFREQ